jgi:DnaJ-class molecular chaperone
MSIDNSNECPACYGSGFDPKMQPVRFGEKLNPVPCKQCNGTGKRQPQPAPSAPCS